MPSRYSLLETASQIVTNSILLHLDNVMCPAAVHVRGVLAKHSILVAGTLWLAPAPGGHKVATPLPLPECICRTCVN